MKTCIITPEAVGPFGNGGVGTHCTNLAAFLSSRLGREGVTLLYTGRIDQENLKYWQAHYLRHYQVNFEWIDPDLLKSQRAAGIVGIKTLDDLMAQAVLDFLLARPFDVCFFQDMLGAGFRVIQAKRTGLAFQNTLLTCMVHSSTRWVDEAMKMQPMYGLSQTLTMFMERYSVEHCDVLLSPSEYMLRWSEQEVGKLPARNHVVSYLSNASHQPVGSRPASSKLLFFGRLEQRKGFVLFLESISLLLKDERVRKPLEIHLLGKIGRTVDGNAKVTLASYSELFGDRVQLVPMNDLGHDEAIAYLEKHNDAVVVCPSVIDNSPNAIIEALQLGVNLVSCHTGGIPELFADGERLCAPDPAALAGLLARALNHELPPVAPRYHPEKAIAEWSSLLDSFQAPVPPPPEHPVGKVTVVVATRERNPGYDQQREALAAQSYRDFEIAETAVRRLKIPADSALVVVPVGCVPAPDALQHLVDALRSSPSDVITAWATVTRRAYSEEVFYCPFGPVHEAIFMGNTLGIGLLAFRPGSVADLKDLENYLFLQRSTWVDIVRIVVNGGRSLDVVPRALSKNASSPFWLTANQRTYDEQMAVIAALSEGLPRWQRRVFEAASGTELRVSSLWSTAKSVAARPAGEQQEAPVLDKLTGFLQEFRILPSMAQTEIFPAIEDELEPFKKYFKGNVLNAGAGDRDISHVVDGKLFNQDIPEGGHTANIHIYSPLHKIPREDGFFDAIICNAVMEHVRNPEEVMAEFARVCKRGGYLFLAIPFMQPEHKDPTDFQRYTEDGIAELVRRHGFEPLHVDGIHSVYTTMAWICRNWLNSRKSVSYFLLKLILFPYLKWKVKSSRFQVNTLQSAYRVLAQKTRD